MTIRKGSKLSPGCVLGPEMVIRPNILLPHFTIGSMVVMDKDGGVKTLDCSTEYFEKGGVFPHSLGESELFSSELKCFEEFLDSDSLTEDEEEFTGDYKEEEPVDFLKEVLETVRRVTSKESTIETVIFEVNNLKYGENKSFGDCLKAFMPEILEELVKLPIEASPEVIMGRIQTLIEFWKPLIGDYSHLLEDGVLLIKEFQGFCDRNERFKSSFHVMLQVL